MPNLAANQAAIFTAGIHGGTLTINTVNGVAGPVAVADRPTLLKAGSRVSADFGNAPSTVALNANGQYALQANAQPLNFNLVNADIN